MAATQCVFSLKNTTYLNAKRVECVSWSLTNPKTICKGIFGCVSNLSSILSRWNCCHKNYYYFTSTYLFEEIVIECDAIGYIRTHEKQLAVQNFYLSREKNHMDLSVLLRRKFRSLIWDIYVASVCIVLIMTKHVSHDLHGASQRARNWRVCLFFLEHTALTKPSTIFSFRAANKCEYCEKWFKHYSVLVA